jgi:hypothetical protein
MDAGYTQQLHPPNGTDDVEDGVHGADFMEVHLMRLNAMHGTFDERDRIEGLHGPRLNGIRRGALLHETSNFRYVAGMRLRRDFKVNFRTGNVAAFGLGYTHRHTLDAERLGKGAQPILVETKFD